MDKVFRLSPLFYGSRFRECMAQVVPTISRTVLEKACREENNANVKLKMLLVPKVK